MKPNIVKIVCFLILLLVHCHVIRAQTGTSWAMVTTEDGKDWPSATEYHCWPEKGINGVDYLRIHDYNGYYAPIKLQYGYRMSDKQIFIYDYESDEERIAFDFTLSTGDHFTTYNGIVWEVNVAMDTLVNVSYKGEGENCTKRLLKVQSIDGRYSDQWLEDFGSFSNHFMILPMIQSGQTQTLWMEYELGCYLIRQVFVDPLYTHDSGYRDYNSQRGNEQESDSAVYSNGILKVEKVGWGSPNREYSLFYRVGDELYRAYKWNISPATGAAIVLWNHETYYFYGIPKPRGGKYTIHYRTNDRPTGIANPSNVTSNNKKELYLYNLSGLKLASKPAKGIYIQNGKKRLGGTR